jgi:3-phenylpropionate/trans-cinnamate dioxygenase ferredoxin reductase subunit
MSTYKYVIVGGGLAGGKACEGIREVDTEGSVALVTQEEHRPYQRPPLSKGYLMGKQGLDKVYLKEDIDYYAQNGVQLITGVRATQVDPAVRTVSLEDGRVLEYEKLLLATGGRAWHLPIPGSDLPGVFALRAIEDADRIREAAQSGKQVLVLGGSFIGSEVASSLAQLEMLPSVGEGRGGRRLDVTMVFPESRLLERVVPEELSAFLYAKYGANGVRVLTGAAPDRLEGDERVARAVLDNGETLEVDLVVMGVGIRLNTELARSAGLEMGGKRAVIVDEYLRTSNPNIYAAGDIAAWPDPTFGRRLRVEHWDVARRQGRRAGQNMAGEEKPYAALPYFFSDLFDLSFEVWGDLTTWDQTVLRGSVDAGRFAFYYFDQGRMVGVLAAGRPDEERKPMQTLVRGRPAYEDVAAKLEDEEVELDDLVV